MSNEIKVTKKNSQSSVKIRNLKNDVSKVKSDCHGIGGKGEVQCNLFEVLSWTKILMSMYSRLYENTARFVEKTENKFNETDAEGSKRF